METTNHGAAARRPGPGPALAAALALASLVSLFLACLLGPLPIPAGDALAILASGAGRLFGFPAEAGADAAWTTVVLDIRLSRVCLSWLVGVCLAVSGTVFQGLLRNPLADPFTLGVSSGAAFGATLAIYCGLSSAAIGLSPGFSALPLAGLAGAMLALTAVVALGRAGGILRRETLVLAGIVVATFLAALISLLKSLDEEAVGAIVFWIMGSFQGRGWSHVLLLAPYALLGLGLTWRYSRELDILGLGDVQARQLGVEVDRVRLALLIGASLMTGASVAVSGVIGFVGLVVPHLVRLVLGSEHRPLLVSAGLLGGLLLLWSDVAARTALPHGVELPVGVVTALTGGPFFCLLLRRRAGETR